MIRRANAIWRGTLKEGKGTLSSGSGVLSNVPYDYRQRFEEAPGTNPEELIAAAHSACFSMALSADLTKAGLTVESVETKATLTFEPKDGKPTITKIHLETVGKVPGTTNEDFVKAAQGAKANCPISRVLNTEITLDAKLA
jgi:osmotically inducible protein OsmC